MPQKLWTRNFTLLITATVLGCMGGAGAKCAQSMKQTETARSE